MIVIRNKLVILRAMLSPDIYDNLKLRIGSYILNINFKKPLLKTFVILYSLKVKMVKNTTRMFDENLHYWLKYNIMDG